MIVRKVLVGDVILVRSFSIGPLENLMLDFILSAVPDLAYINSRISNDWIINEIISFLISLFLGGFLCLIITEIYFHT
jgi:hypothetical protein